MSIEFNRSFTINPEPITVKGIKTYNPKLLRIYTNQADEPYAFDPVAKKTQGSALGAIYKKHHQLDLDKKWMGKVGNPKELQNDPNSTKTKSKRGINVDVIYEKLASDLFQELGRGYITVPKTHLAYLPLFNDFTNNQWLARVYEEDLQMDSSLRIMSYYLDGYENLRTTHTLDEGEKISFLDYLKKHHRPPERILSPEYELVPLEGMIPLLAIGRCLAEVDLLGGSGRNAGFQWIYDDEGHVQKAQIVKIDPGYAFVFTHDPERPEEPCENALINTQLKLGSFKYYLDDYRDIQTSTNNFDTLVKWEALTPSQKDQFLAVLLNTSRYIQSENLLSFLFNRDGAFFHSNVAELPQEHAQKTRAEMRDWLNWQLEIYDEPLQDFLERHPEQLLRIRYIDDLGELPLPMSEKSLPIRELFSELALVIPEEERHKEIDGFEMLESETKTIQLDQLFSKEIKKVVITGESGTGKSTLCQKIAHDWASGRLFSDKFDAVFWIPLRKLNGKVPNESAVLGLANYVATQILKNPQLLASLLNLIEEFKVLFVLDGFDEASKEVKTSITSLFEEERFYLLLTARPETDGLPNWSHVKNTGFSSAHIEHYIEQFFGEKNPSFLNKLRSDPSLSALAKNPFQLQMLCHLEKKGLNTGSRTYLYQTMISQMLKWESEHRGGQTNEELLLPIGKAAYLAWQRGEALSEEHFQEALKESNHTLEDCRQTGLMKGYEFAHTSIEEYLIAHYLGCVSDVELENFLSKAHKEERSDNIFRFLFGILYQKDPKNVQKFFRFFEVTEDNFHTALACLNECEGFVGDVRELEIFLKNPKNLNSSIEYTVEHKFIDTIIWLHGKNPHALKEFRGKNEMNFLMLAAYHGFLELLDWGKEYLGDQIQKTTTDGLTPMHAAAFNGHVEAMQWFHQKDPTLVQKTTNGATPLHLAAYNGHIQAMQWVHNLEPSLILKTSFNGATPLHDAAQNGHVPAMKWLHEIEPSLIQKTNSRGSTPMLLAVSNRHVPAMQWLHDKNPSLIQKTNADGATPMHVAALYGHVEAMQWLHDKDPSLLQKTDSDQWTPMHSAASNGHVEAMQWLYEKDHSLLQKTDPDQRTPMHSAASSGHVEAMQWLYEKDHSLLQKSDLWTLMLEAASNGHVEAMQWLYEKDRSLLQKSDLWTLMLEAASNGHVEAMQWLFEKDLSLLQRIDYFAFSPMHTAAQNGQVEAMRWLYNKNAFLVRQRDRDGTRPMHVAAQGGQVEAMRWLYNKDPSLIQKTDRKGWNPMHVATLEGQIEAMQWLHDKDPSLVRKTKQDGSTPMHVAATVGDIEAMQWLYEKDPTLLKKRDILSATPLDIARICEHTHIVEFLENQKDTEKCTIS